MKLINKFKQLRKIDKILVSIALILFVGMLVLEFCPVSKLVHIIVGAVVGIYFLVCLIYFSLRDKIKKSEK